MGSSWSESTHFSRLSRSSEFPKIQSMHYTIITITYECQQKKTPQTNSVAVVSFRRWGNGPSRMEVDWYLPVVEVPGVSQNTAGALYCGDYNLWISGRKDSTEKFCGVGTEMGPFRGNGSRNSWLTELRLKWLSFCKQQSLCMFSISDNLIYQDILNRINYDRAFYVQRCSWIGAAAHKRKATEISK